MRLFRFRLARVVEPVMARLVPVAVVKVTPDDVSTLNIEDEAAFNIWKARPFRGVCMVEVAP